MPKELTSIFSNFPILPVEIKLKIIKHYFEQNNNIKKLYIIFKAQPLLYIHNKKYIKSCFYKSILQSKTNKKLIFNNEENIYTIYEKLKNIEYREWWKAFDEDIDSFLIRNVNYIYITVKDNKVYNLPVEFRNKIKILKTNIYLKNLETFFPNIYDFSCCYWGDRELPLFPRLKILDCSYNNLTIIPYYKNLNTLICGGNKLTNIPEYPELIFLDCIGNRLSNLPFFPKLLRLDCFCNDLVIIREYPMLRVLNCSNNMLTEISDLPWLEVLISANNYIKEYPFFPLLKYMEC